jgi:hypothetical protein
LHVAGELRAVPIVILLQTANEIASRKPKSSSWDVSFIRERKVFWYASAVFDIEGGGPLLLVVIGVIIAFAA